MPDTASYLYSGLGIGLGIMAVYIVSIVVRFRSTAKDMQTIKELQED